MLDFDKIFEEYFMEWYTKHSQDYEDIESVEEQITAVYDEWSNMALEQLGNISPKAYFDNIDSPKELVDMLISTSEQNPTILLLNRISEVEECGVYLQEIIIDDKYSVKQKMLAVNLVLDLNLLPPLDVLVDWIKDTDSDNELKEFAVETLTGFAQAVKTPLVDFIEYANEQQKLYIAEILVNAEKDERTFNLLIELFKKGDNIPFIAALLGKYGDERCSNVLYKALDNCNFLEYIEIKNAIERLGGIVEDTRDFSDDMYYKAIKNLK